MDPNDLVTIRVAKPGDEAEIANVHLNSWREAYRGLLPQDMLDSLPLTFKKRKLQWQNAIIETQTKLILVADNYSGIVGFALFTACRDPGMEKMAEVAAIYLFEKFKGQGVGFALLSSGLKQMCARGFQEAYCWVLDKNPTIKFYERSGARFTGQIKEDIIGGKAVQELAFGWNLRDYNWAPLSLPEVQEVLRPLNCEWRVAGGWAIDLFLKKQTRIHEDVDILIMRDDQLKFQESLAAWDLWVSDPPGRLRPWKKNEFLGKGIQDIWCRRKENDPWRFQAMLFDVEKGEWIFKRKESIRADLTEITLTSEEGIQFLAPHIQLLYKSKSLRQKDQLDFSHTYPVLNPSQKTWLKNALNSVYPNGHSWMTEL